MNDLEKKTIRNLSLVGIIGNIILSVFKLIAGIFGMSSAMVSDALHSFSDVVVTFIALLGTKISHKEADSDHPYGHEKYESIVSFVLGCILAATGLSIGCAGIQTIISGNYSNLEVPTLLPLIAALVSIAGKEAMFRYTMHFAKKIGSAAFEADAWHHRSDAISSIGAFAGIGAAKLGFPVMDPLAGVLICLCILKMAFDIFRNAIKMSVDTSCSDSFEQELIDFAKSIEGVVDVDMLRTRLFGNKVYVDMEIAVDRKSTLVEAHDISEKLHDGLELNFENVKHVMIHVNPTKK